jgi:hypothetical protein
MKQMPSIGTRVRYERKKTAYLTERSCTGTVVAQYRGGYPCYNEETGEKWLTPDSVAVKVDAPLPAWWPYNGTDRFAPDVSEIEVVKAGKSKLRQAANETPRKTK